MSELTFATADLTTFARVDELGLEVVGQRVEPGRAVLACRVVEPDDWCRRCGCQGRVRDTVRRRLAHEPFGWRPTTLLVTVRRYRCPGCGHVWRQDTSKAAAPRAKISRRGMWWALTGIVVAHLNMARVAAGLAVAWDTANTAVLAEGKRILINDEHRYDGVAVIGVDEHCWRHTRKGDKFVTVIIDLTPVRDRKGPARLLDMVDGRSKKVFKTWLAARPQAWRAGLDVVAMDGFTGFKTAAAEELPAATAVMDPLHVVRLAGEGLEKCRQRVQQDTLGHGGRRGDPLFQARRTLHTGDALLTDRQRERLMVLFTPDEHAQVEATWGVYQRIITAYREPDPHQGKGLMQAVIDSLREGVPTVLTATRKLGRTLNKRRRPGLLRPTRHIQRPNRSDQRPPGTPTLLSPRLPRPHQLHRPLPPRGRRIQTTATPCFGMSRQRPLGPSPPPTQAPAI